MTTLMASNIRSMLPTVTKLFVVGAPLLHKSLNEVGFITIGEEPLYF
jgi:hypothetical protein